MGAEFAVGFLYGAKSGGFDDVELFKCLQKEVDADALFTVSDARLKKALNDNDTTLGIQALTDLIGFVAEMAVETDSAGNAKCPLFREQQVNWDDIKQMILTMR